VKKNIIEKIIQEELIKLSRVVEPTHSSQKEKFLNEKKGVKHYTKDGNEWTGPTHKMPDGTLMTQDPHSKDSEKLFHKEDLTEGNNFNMVSAKFKDALDDASEISTDSVKKLIKKFKEKRPDAAMEYAKQAFGWMFKEGKLNEAEYVIIDTRGNARSIGSKIQGQRFLKGKKGFHIVLKKNALKARRAIEKNGGKTTGAKISDTLYDMMHESITEAKKLSSKELRDLKVKIGNARTIGKYFTKDEVEFLKSLLSEGKLTEGKRISFRDMGISNLMDLKLYTDKLAKANIDWNQKGQALVFNNTNDAKKAKQLLGLDEGKLPEASLGNSLRKAHLARGLKPLLTIGTKISSKVGENALIKLSDKFDKIDDEQADDIASHLNMGIELMQDGSPSEARGWFKKFNKVCKDALSGKSVKSAMEGVSESVNEAKEDYKYKKQVGKAFDKINDAMFNFRHAFGVKQLTNDNMKLKKKFEALQANIFALQRELRSDGLSEGKLTEGEKEALLGDPKMDKSWAKKTDRLSKSQLQKERDRLKKAGFSHGNIWSGSKENMIKFQYVSQLLKEGKLTEAKIKKGDIIKMDDGEYGVVNKVSGRVAYIKLPSSPGSFHPIEAARITYKGKHKGKDLYNEGKLNEMELNDPILIAVRARKTMLDKAKSAPKLQKISTKQYYKLMDKEIDIINQMKDAAKEFDQMNSDMLQDAGQKGEAWSDKDANKWGGGLDRLQTKVEKLAAKKKKVKADIMNYRVN